MGNFLSRTTLIGSMLAALASAALSSAELTHAADVDYSKLSDAERIELSRATEVWGPEPRVVEARVGAAPSDAIELLASGDLDAWESVSGDSAPWMLENGVLTVKPASGDIRTRQSFCDVQLHLEWRTPTVVAGMAGQQRYNSGVMLQDRYEIQILDSYRNPTYANGQAGALYKQVPPLVNAMRPPGEWQSYDIIFTAPRFDGEALVSKGYLTVLHNGVLLHNHVEIQGTTEWIGPPKVVPHGCAPLRLQDHGNPVSFRNIWVREL